VWRQISVKPHAVDDDDEADREDHGAVRIEIGRTPCRPRARSPTPGSLMSDEGLYGVVRGR
jgi:hypothetical protein